MGNISNHPIQNLVGFTQGNLTAIKMLERTPYVRTMWECVCNCGRNTCAKLIIVAGRDLVSGHTTSCKHQQFDKSIHPVLRRIFVGLRGNAITRNHIFDLTISEFISIIKQPCKYCGDNTDIKRSGKFGVRANGVDRMDSALGYSFDNCVPCCEMCNYMKRIHTPNEFIRHAKRIAEFNKDIIWE